MFATIANIWKVADLRRRVLMTLGLILVYRIGTFIPAPDTNPSVLSQLSTNNPVFGLLNTFSGGALSNFSIFAMSVTPYITSSIIVQLLSMGVIRCFEEWNKEGEYGRRKLTQYTRYGTVLLSLLQAVGFSISFNRMVPGLVLHPSFTSYALIAITLTAGSTFLMWLGEQITEHGIGNGISILIFISIISRVERGVQVIYTSWFYQHPDRLFLNVLMVLIMLAGIVVVVAGVIYVYQGVRRIPIQYAKRVVGRKMYGGQSTHLPLKVNAAGVIPVIFATSLLFLPAQIGSFFGQSGFWLWVRTVFSPPSVTYLVLLVVFILGFTFFYTYVQINPVQLAEQMKKNGGFIPGVRPGKATETYVLKIMNRITMTGALFLAAVSLLPYLFLAATGLNSLYFGGTSLLIVVGVALETMKQLESQLVQRHYRGFIR